MFLSKYSIFQGDLEFIFSQRKRPLLIINDYLYRKNRNNYWRCIRCTSAKCRSSLILNDFNEVTICIGDHTHPPEKKKISEGVKTNYTVLYKMEGNSSG